MTAFEFFFVENTFFSNIEEKKIKDSSLTGYRQHISQKFVPDFSHVPNSLMTTVEYKIDYISKTKSLTEETHEHKNTFQNIAQFLRRTLF